MNRRKAGVLPIIGTEGAVIIRNMPRSSLRVLITAPTPGMADVHSSGHVVMWPCGHAAMARSSSCLLNCAFGIKRLEKLTAHSCGHPKAASRKRPVQANEGFRAGEARRIQPHQRDGTAANSGSRLRLETTTPPGFSTVTANAVARLTGSRGSI